MKPIENWDNLEKVEETKSLPAGIYGLVITKVVNHEEENFMEVFFDIAKGEYKDYFKNIQKNLSDGKVARNSSERLYYTDASMKFFRAFITRVEDSNPGFVFKETWDEQKLVGKFVIGVFGEEEYYKDGQVKKAVNFREFRSLVAYKEGKIAFPSLIKMTDAEIAEAKAKESGSSGSTEVPSDINLDDMPW